MFLAAFLLGIGVGLVLGVAVAVRGQHLDEEFDRLFAHGFPTCPQIRGHETHSPPCGFSQGEWVR